MPPVRTDLAQWESVEDRDAGLAGTGGVAAAAIREGLAPVFVAKGCEWVGFDDWKERLNTGRLTAGIALAPGTAGERGKGGKGGKGGEHQETQQETQQEVPQGGILNGSIRTGQTSALLWERGLVDGLVFKISR